MMRTMIVTTFGLGFMRPASGTWGSLPPAGIAWAMLLLGVGWPAIEITMLVICALSCVGCVLYGTWAEERFNKKDPSEVVIDETAGMCIPLLGLTQAHAELAEGGFWRVSLVVGSAFVLFRIADIFKPPPANQLQKLPGGWGVLVDDLVAGVYAAIAMQLGLRLLF